MYSLACGRVFSLAPKKYSMSSRKSSETSMNIAPIMIFKLTTLLSTLLQALYFFLPRNTDRIVAAPAPTKVPNAVDRFINGKVTASPDMANGPTPCPI